MGPVSGVGPVEGADLFRECLSIDLAWRSLVQVEGLGDSQRGQQDAPAVVGSGGCGDLGAEIPASDRLFPSRRVGGEVLRAPAATRLVYDGDGIGRPLVLEPLRASVGD